MSSTRLGPERDLRHSLSSSRDRAVKSNEGTISRPALEAESTQRRPRNHAEARSSQIAGKVKSSQASPAAKSSQGDVAVGLGGSGGTASSASDPALSGSRPPIESRLGTIQTTGVGVGESRVRTVVVAGGQVNAVVDSQAKRKRSRKDVGKEDSALKPAQEVTPGRSREKAPKRATKKKLEGAAQQVTQGRADTVDASVVSTARASSTASVVASTQGPLGEIPSRAAIGQSFVIRFDSEGSDEG